MTKNKLARNLFLQPGIQEQNLFHVCAAPHQELSSRVTLQDVFALKLTKKHSCLGS